MSTSLLWLLLTLAPVPGAAAAPTPAAGPAPAAAPAAAPAGEPDALAEQAAALYEQRKFLEAALILEDLWARVHEPRDLFNAGLARLALGHRAHALYYWELYLQQPNIPDDGREQAKARIKKAQAAATGVIVKLAPSAVAELGATLTLVRLDNEKDRRPEITYDLAPRASEFSSGGKTLYLDPGKWQLKVGSRTYVTATRELLIKPGAPGFVLDVVLANDPNYRFATFQIDPPDAVAAGATVTLQKLALGAQPVPCPLDAAGKCGVKVEPGDWEVTVQAPGYQRHVEKVSLGAQPLSTFGVALAPVVAAAPVVAPTPTPTPVTPEPAPAPAAEGPPAAPAAPERVPKNVRLKLSAGLITAGIPVFITGLALAVHGSNVYDEKNLTTDRDGELVPAIRIRAAGAGLMGSAVGLWMTGLTAEYDVKPWVWFTELGIGAAAAIGGTAWLGVTNVRWNSNAIEQMVCNNNEGVDCFVAHRMGAGFLAGFGVSAIVGSTTGLLVQRKYGRAPRVSLAPSFGAGSGGVVVGGRF